MNGRLTRRQVGKLALAGIAAAALGRPGAAEASHGNAMTWYFAEGYTGAGFDEFLTIQNPNGKDVNVWVTYYYYNATTGQRYAPLTKGPIRVDPQRRATISVHDNVNDPYGLGRGYAVSAKVWTDNPLGIVVERPMYFIYGGNGFTADGGHNVLGATEPRTTWYFAEGYTGAGFDEYLCLFNPNGADAAVRITFSLPGGGTVTRTYTVPGQARSTVVVHDPNQGVGRNTAPSAKVESTNGVGIIAERPMYFVYGSITDGHNVIGANAPQTAWFFAEGSSVSGYDTFLCLYNPHATGCTVWITCYPVGAAPITKSLPLGATSRYTVGVHDPATYGIGRGYEVAIKVTTDHRDGIVVERPMYFNYGSGQKGGHDGVGVTPRNDVGQFVWWFAEGWTGAGFDEFVTIQNPNDLAANVTFTYMLEGGGEIVVQDFVPGNQRKTFNVRNQIGSEKAVSLKLRADRPINAERPMYFNYNSANTGLAEGGHNTPGAVTAEYTWYLAEGTTRVGFDSYLTIQNPGNAGPNNGTNSWASVEVTYYTAGGSQYGPYTYSIPPKTRATIIPRDLLGWNQDFATQIKSNFPIVVERPMYFRYGVGDWRDGTVVVGTPKPEYRFYFAEGWTGDGFDEFLAIHNSNDTAYALVTVQYMLAGGGGPVKSYWVAPKARLTLNVRAEVGAGQAVSMRVSSDLPIVAERPMYFNYYGSMGWVDGGHVAMGYSP